MGHEYLSYSPVCSQGTQSLACNLICPVCHIYIEIPTDSLHSCYFLGDPLGVAQIQGITIFDSPELPRISARSSIGPLSAVEPFFKNANLTTSFLLEPASCKNCLVQTK